MHAAALLVSLVVIGLISVPLVSSDAVPSGDSQSLATPAGISTILPEQNADMYGAMNLLYSLDDPSESVMELEMFVRRDPDAPTEPGTLHIVLFGGLSAAEIGCGSGQVVARTVSYGDLGPAERDEAIRFYVDTTTSEPGINTTRARLLEERRSVSPQVAESIARKADFLLVAIPLDQEHVQTSSVTNDDGSLVTTEHRYDHTDLSCVLDASALTEAAGSQVVVTSPRMSMGRPTALGGFDTDVCQVFSIVRSPRLLPQFSSNESLTTGGYSRCDVPQDQAISWGSYEEFDGGNDGSFQADVRSGEYAVFEDSVQRHQLERRTFLIGVALGILGSLFAGSLLAIIAWWSER